MSEIGPYEFMAREFERLAVLRKMWSANEVAKILRQYDIEKDAIATLVRERDALREALTDMEAYCSGGYDDGRSPPRREETLAKARAALTAALGGKDE